MEEEGAVTGELLAQWRVQPRGQDIGASDASQGLRGNRLERNTSAGYRLVSAVWKETQCSEHVGASFARVWIRETVQRGRSYPMDAGELVRLHCNVSAPFIIPYIAMNGFSTVHSTRRARAKCVLEPVAWNIHPPRLPGLNLAVSSYISLFVIIREFLTVLHKMNKFMQAFSRVRKRRSATFQSVCSHWMLHALPLLHCASFMRRICPWIPVIYSPGITAAIVL